MGQKSCCEPCSDQESDKGKIVSVSEVMVDWDESTPALFLPIDDEAKALASHGASPGGVMEVEARETRTEAASKMTHLHCVIGRPHPTDRPICQESHLNEHHSKVTSAKLQCSHPRKIQGDQVDTFTVQEGSEHVRASSSLSNSDREARPNLDKDQPQPINHPIDQEDLVDHHDAKAATGEIDIQAGDRNSDLLSSTRHSGLDEAGEAFNQTASRDSAFGRISSLIVESISHIVARLLTWNPTVDDPELRGICLQQSDDNVTAGHGKPAQQTSSSAHERALNVLIAFPRHWALELRLFLIPLPCCLLFVCPAGIIARERLASQPGFQGSLAKSFWEPRGTMFKLLTVAVTVSVTTSVWIHTLTLLRTLWSWRVIKRAILAVWVPGFVLHSTWVSLQFVLPREVWTLVHITSAVICLSFIVWWCSTLARQQWFGWFYIGIYLQMYVIQALYLSTAGDLLFAPHMIKALMIGLINPLLFEVPLTMTRFIARCVQHNDPSTSFLIIVHMMISKQVVGRFLTATISNSRIVLLLSIWSGVCEFMFRSTMPLRDRFLYRCLFQRCAQGQSVYTKMASTRNRRLRAQNSAMESFSEIVAIWSGVAMVLSFDISLSGSSSPQVLGCIRNGLIQTVFELVTDLACAMWIAVAEGKDVLQLAKGRYWYWSLPTIPSLISGTMWLADSLIPRAICHTPGAHEATWVSCTSTHD